jgi:hypothetical protein
VFGLEGVFEGMCGDLLITTMAQYLNCMHLSGNCGILVIPGTDSETRKMHSQGEAMTRLEKQVKENEHEIDGLKERLRSVVVSVDEEEKGPTQ